MVRLFGELCIHHLPGAVPLTLRPYCRSRSWRELPFFRYSPSWRWVFGTPSIPSSRMYTLFIQGMLCCSFLWYGHNVTFWGSTWKVSRDKHLATASWLDKYGSRGGDEDICASAFCGDSYTCAGTYSIQKFVQTLATSQTVWAALPIATQCSRQSQ